MALTFPSCAGVPPGDAHTAAALRFHTLNEVALRTVVMTDDGGARRATAWSDVPFLRLLAPNATLISLPAVSDASSAVDDDDASRSVRTARSIDVLFGGEVRPLGEELRQHSAVIELPAVLLASVRASAFLSGSTADNATGLVEAVKHIIANLTSHEPGNVVVTAAVDTGAGVQLSLALVPTAERDLEVANASALASILERDADLLNSSLVNQFGALGVSTRLLAIGGAVTDTMDDDPFVMRRFLEEGSTSSTGTAPLVFEPRDAPLHTPPNFEFYNPSLVMVDSLYPLSGSTDGRVSSRARSLSGS